MQDEATTHGIRGLKVAVLGSTSGIGQATVELLAASGADVLIHGYRSRDRAEAVVDRCRAYGVRAHSFLADLSDPAAGMELVHQAWEIWGGLDGWLHFAGADTLTGSHARLPFSQKLDLLWKVDVRATIELCRHVGERMVKQGAGVIVTMGWDQAEIGMEGDSGQLFAATKGAVMAFTRSLAVELAPRVRVNAVAPGWIRTAWGEQAPSAWKERAIREAPLGRWGTPDDVARVARFLLSHDAAFLTGQILRVGGGAVR